MIRLLISIGIRLLANTIGLLIAAVVLDGMTIDGAAFVVAVVIFTAVEVIAEPLVRQAAERNVRALSGGVALVATFVGLLVTDLVSDGLSIDGWSTWLFPTVIVWVGALLAALILPIFLVKQHREDAR
jgi:putative membrane protein